MASRVVVIGVATQACLCRRQRRIPPPSRTSSSSSSADGGLRLVLSPAPRCRHRHCGYMGVATHIGGAPRPCVVVLVLVLVGSARRCGSRYPRRRVVVLMSRSWNTGVASRIGGASPTTRPGPASSTSRTHEGCCFNRGVWVAASCCRRGVGCMGGRVNTRYVSLRGVRVVRKGNRSRRCAHSVVA